MQLSRSTWRSRPNANARAVVKNLTVASRTRSRELCQIVGRASSRYSAGGGRPGKCSAAVGRKNLPRSTVCRRQIVWVHLPMNPPSQRSRVISALQNAPRTKHHVPTILVEELVSGGAGLVVLQGDVEGADIVEPNHPTIDMRTISWGSYASQSVSR